ncbi:MAG: DUF1905 domain-containing protein [Bacteroidetes bacterium]|nr:DUF1905 domain-containing protein [Bacteroidota bacterium]
MPAPPESCYEFEAPLVFLGVEYNMYVVVFPYPVETLFGTRGKVRVQVQMLGQQEQQSLHPSGDGTHFLIVNKRLRTRHQLQAGDKVYVRLWPDDHLLLPEELAYVLETDAHARVFFNQLSAGMQHHLAYWVRSAKRTETRANRAVKLLNQLLQDHFVWGGREYRRQ